MKSYELLSIDEEKKLISGCLSGSKAGWDRFVTQYKNLIYKFICKTLNLSARKADHDLLEELFQEVFIALLSNDYHKLRSFTWKNGVSIIPWLSIVVRRLVIDYLRKQNLHKDKTESLDGDSGTNDDSSTSLADRIEDKKLSLESQVLPKDELEVVVETVKEMSFSDQLLFKLLFKDDLAVEDVAKAMDKSIDALYMQKKRMLDKLKLMLKKKDVRSA